MSDLPENIYLFDTHCDWMMHASIHEDQGYAKYIRADLFPTWQPIATAPHDIGPILAKNKFGLIMQVHWSSGSLHHKDCWVYDDEYYFDAIEWMKIP